jgi:hypothetical protein
MTIASGVQKQVIISKETTWGVKPAAGTGKYYRRVGLDLNLNRDSFTSAEISSTAQTLDMRTGTDNVEGTFNAEMSAGTYADFWGALLRGTWVAGSTLTATTISAAATTNKFVRGSGSWITDGYKVGDLVKVTGFVTVGNNGKFTVTGVTATDLVVDAVLINEAAGPSVTVAVPGKKLAIPILPSNRTNESFTIEQYFDSISVSRVATGVKVGGASVSIQPNAMATVDFALMGKDMATSASPYFTTPAAGSVTSVLAGNNGTIYSGGVKIATVTSLTVEITGNMESGTVVGNLLPDGTRPAADIFLGRITGTGELSAYFENDTFFTKFRDEQDLSLVFRLNGDGDQAFILKFPRIKLGGASVDDKEVGGLIQTIPFTALLNDGLTNTIEQSTVVIQDTTLV